MNFKIILGFLLGLWVIEASDLDQDTKKITGERKSSKELSVTKRAGDEASEELSAAKKSEDEAFEELLGIKKSESESSEELSAVKKSESEASEEKISHITKSISDLSISEFFYKPVTTRFIDIPTSPLASPSAKSTFVYTEVGKVLKEIENNYYSTEEFLSTKNLDEYEFLANAPHGIYIKFFEKMEKQKYLLYLRAYYRSDGSIPSTLDSDMIFDPTRIEDLCENRTLLRSFCVLDKNGDTRFYAGSQRTKVKEVHNILYRFLTSEKESEELDSEDDIY